MSRATATAREDARARSGRFGKQPLKGDPGELDFDDPVMAEAEFIATFRPVDAPNGTKVWPADAVIDDAPECNLWSVKTAADGSGLLYSGWYSVDVSGYVITEKPWIQPVTIQFAISYTEE